MTIAKITFEDDGENVIIGIENVTADKQTSAQEAAGVLFNVIKERVKEAIASETRTRYKKTPSR